MSPAKSRQWELVLDLVSPLLDPKTLAISSCVSRRWSSALSSPHIWAPLLLSRYPSLSPLLPSSSGDPRHLFSLLQTSSSLRRRRTPRRPIFSLSDVVLSLDVFYAGGGGGHVLSVLEYGYELNREAGVFRFDVEVENGAVAAVDAAREMRVVWNVVVMEGWRGAVAVMDTVGRGRAVGGGGEDEIWFSEELPPGNAGCSVSDGGFSGGGGVVAELGLGLGEGRRVERVRFGLMSSVKEWRYLTVEDALLHMQPFLLQSNVWI